MACAQRKVGEYSLDEEEIGRGSFGDVFKGVDAEGRIIAAKRINVKKHKKAASKEIVNFYKLPCGNKHIINFLEVIHQGMNVWLIMEFCNIGDLDTFFQYHTAQLIDAMTKVQYCVQIARGLVFLHERNIVHRDLKPANILASEESDGTITLKLADFGLAKFIESSHDSSMNSDVGTKSFKAPEFWMKTGDENDTRILKYKRTVDIFSVGLTYLAMLQFQPGHILVPCIEGTLDETSEGHSDLSIGMLMVTREQKNQPALNVVVIKETDDDTTCKLKEIIINCTQMKPENRLTAPDLLEQLQQIMNL